MPNKIKSAKARARAAGDAKKKDRASWFENHVIIDCGGDEEKEQKLKEALKARVIMGQSGG